MMPGVYLPEELRAHQGPRRGHGDMPRQVQNKCAAKKMREKTKAYESHLGNCSYALDVDNFVRQNRVNEARKLQEHLAAKKKALQEQLNLRALLEFSVADVSNCIASPESFSSGSVTPTRQIAWPVSVLPHGSFVSQDVSMYPQACIRGLC
eukprot:CFRG3183T1